MHQFKFSFGPIEVPLKLVGCNRLEIPERLEKADLQTEIVRNAPNLGGRTLVKEEVVFKYFYRIKMGGSDGFNFLLETSTE